MKNKLLLGLLVFTLAAALVGGATMAWFTDAAETETVDFQAGTLMIDVDNPTQTGTYEANLERLNPGDCAEWEFNVENAGTKGANWLLYMCWQDVVGRDNDKLPDGQQGLLLNKEGYGTDGLSEIVLWTIKVDGTPVYEEEVLAGAPLVLSELTTFDPGPGTKTVTVTACLPGLETGNQYQGARMDLLFGVKAWQTTNNAPPFDPENIVCPWDTGNEDPPSEFTAFDFQLVGFSGTNHGGITQPYGEITGLRDKDGNLVSGPVDVTITQIENHTQPVTVTPVTKPLTFAGGYYKITNWDSFDLVIDSLTQHWTYEVTIGGLTKTYRW